MSINNIYPVSVEAQAEIDELLEASEGELTPEIEGKIKELARIERVTDLANYYHRLDAQVRAKEAEIAPVIDSLEGELKLIKNRREKIKQYLTMCVSPGKEFITDTVAVWYRESTQVDVINEKLIPIDYTRVETSPDKIAIKQALKEGKEVPGAQLLINHSIQIEHPGERAKANSKTRQKNRAKKNIDLSTAITEEA